MKNNNITPSKMLNLTQFITYFLTTGFIFTISVIPTLFWLLFSGPNFFDIIALGLMFPSLAAMVSCSVKYKESEEKMKFQIVKHFLEGYKKNFKDTIKYCFIYAGILFVVFLGFTNIEEMSIFMMVAFGLLTTLSTLIVTYMMLVATKFQFNLKGLFKIGIYCILMNFKITAKIFLVYVALFFLYPWVGVFPMLLFVSPVTYLIIHFVGPVFEEVYELFVEKPE